MDPSPWSVRLAAISVLALVWAVCRSYQGIQHDARLYVGRALADLHPDTIGQEIAFAHDGQSAFSLFPLLMRTATVWLGPSTAAMAITTVGLIIWIAAAAALLSRFVRGPQLWLGLLAVAALPTGYGGHSLLEIAEPFATPRIFAEALGLLALTALLHGSRSAYFALLAAATLLHPIMALPIAAVGFAILCVQDRRWLWVLPIAIVGIFAGTAFHLPIFSRLTETFDPVWLNIITQRSPHIFPRLWWSADWALLLLQLLSVALLCLTPNPRLRTIAIAVAAAAVAGIAISAFIPTVLIAQAQTWRTQWLAAFLAPAMFPHIAELLRNRGGLHRAIIPLMALAWIFHDRLIGVAVIALVIGLLSWIALLRVEAPLLPKLAWAVAATAGLLALIAKLYAAHVVFTDMPEGAHRYLVQTLTVIFEFLAIFLGAAGFPAIRLAFLPIKLALVLLSALALGAALVLFDARSPYAKALEGGVGSAHLRETLRSGTVQWLGDRSELSWFWTGRPQWWSEPAGAGAVFDRTLALEWERRRQALAGSGLIPSQTDRAKRLKSSQKIHPIIVEKIYNFCKSNNSPDWVVAPIGNVDEGIELMGSGDRSRVWRSPESDNIYRSATGEWIGINRYVILACG